MTNPPPQEPRLTLTERWVTAFGFGCGITFAAAAIWLMFTVANHLVHWECATKAGGTIIWMPEN